ncbi:MAG: N-6 DNA methylase [Sulfolobales archaeon]
MMLRSFGIDAVEVSDRDRAYKILVDSLAYIVNATGIRLSAEGMRELLSRIGIEVDENAIGSIIRDIGKEMGRVSYGDIEVYRYEVPRLLSLDVRKRLAAYYTGPLGARIMGLLVRRFVEKTGRNDIVVADPFMGTAITLTEAIKSLGVHRVRRVWGVEKQPLACIVAYASLLGVIGIDDAIDVKCGDSFKIIWGKTASLDRSLRGGNIYRADAVLTNPPFTRWEALEESYRGFLMEIAALAGYSRFISRRQINLQALSLFLIDSVLSEGGLLATILPASTFYTIYGQGVKSLLRERYRVAAMIQRAEPAFSIDCGFKEVILIAMKRYEHSGGTAFITIEDEEILNMSALVENILGVDPGHGGHGYRVNLVDLYRLPYILDMNWLLLFEESEVKRLVIDTILSGLNQGVLALWKDVLGRQSIVRGVEMYGPDFFILPNRYWAVGKAWRDRVIVRNINRGEELEIDMEYLIPSLRKPGLYLDKIVVQPDHYLVSIPPKDLEDLPRDIRRYIEWGVEAAAALPAIRSFGRYWYSHIYRQMHSKNPFGHLFLPDKVDATFRNRGVFAIVSLDRTTATKNFYIMINNSRYAPLLALWFNSSLFLLLFIYGSRKIGETWTRFLENDYLNMPIPNPKIARTYLEEASKLINSLKNLTFPPLKHQLYRDYRREIDELIVKILGLHDPKGFVERLHDLLAEAL